jgi:lactate dehydrogenase-like 2-hydroxyacid dehydrogenase
MRPKVLLPKSWKDSVIYGEALEILRSIADVEFISKERFEEQLAEAEGIVGYGVGEEILRKAPRLKVVARYGVGYDDCDVEAMTRHKVYLVHTPGVLSDSVADMAIALMLACNRRIVQADRYVREDWAKKAARFAIYGVDLKGKTVGIIGLGRIGYEVAKRCARGFGMRVIYHDVRRNEEAERELGARRKSLEEVMRESDFVSIHLPLTPETRGLIKEKHLRMMKRTAFLINTARGPVIDQEALTRVLAEKAIAGAGLDVFEKEPVPLDDPLLRLDNVVLTPHIASLTIEARRAMAICNARNIAAVLRGDIPPPNVVPEQRGLIFKK